MTEAPASRPAAASGAPVVRMGNPSGPYRRRIRLEQLDPATVWGGLEDDFHHFEVNLQHDTERVRAISMLAVRWPWTTCPDAGAGLQALVGMALDPRCTAVARVADPRWNCTHQFDLAGLCVAHAARRLARRQYDVELSPVTDGIQVARMWRDGTLAYEWTLEVLATGERRLLTPEAFTTAPWRGGFIRWADETLPSEEAEAAIVLRRACDIGMGRAMDLEAIDCAAELAGLMAGICYSMQPEVMPVAFRNRGSIRDFARHPDALLAGRGGDQAADPNR